MAEHSARCPACGSIVQTVNATTAGTILGLSERRVRQLIADGRLPGSDQAPGKKPATWRIPLASIAALIEAREGR